MSSNGWKIVQLEEICTMKYGKMPKKDKIKKSGYPIYTGYRIAGYYDEYMFEEPEVVVVARGVGGTGDVKLSPPKAYLTNISIALILNENDVEKKFIYYNLKNENLKVLDTGSAQSQITISDLKKKSINLPPLEEQKAIAKILSDLDAKIEVNNQISQRLEEMAQALFKHWFVDFEFPNEDGEPYKSSGGEMIESELGMIPKGWEVVQLGEISEIQNGFAFKAPDYVQSGIKVMRTLNINSSGYFQNDNIVYLPKEYDCEKYKKYILNKFDVALVMVGASIGKVGMVLGNTSGSLQNQNMWRFRAKNNMVSQLYLNYIVRLAQAKAKNWSNGSARDFYRKDSFSKITIIKPRAKQLNLFDENVLPLFEQINNLNDQTDILKQTRDTLLPKLMSGELRVTDIQD